MLRENVIYPSQLSRRNHHRGYVKREHQPNPALSTHRNLRPILEGIKELEKTVKRLMLAIIGIAILTGCTPDAPKFAATPQNTPITKDVFRDYGNGVYVVDYGTGLANDLSAFIALHPDLRVTAMYAASEGAYGSTTSVVIVTEVRK